MKLQALFFLLSSSVFNVSAVDIQRNWYDPYPYVEGDADSGPFAAITVNVGDTLIFNWTSGNHDVWIHPSGSCAQTNRIPVGAVTGSSYTFKAEDVGDMLFTCDVPVPEHAYTNHCKSGQKLPVVVENQVIATPAPTPAPTPALTSAPPTAAPTGAPTTVRGTKCVDSSLRLIQEWNMSEKWCVWAGKKEVRCQRIWIQSHCPVTCGACEQYECKDSLKKFFVPWNNEAGKMKKGCGWIGKQPETRCELFGGLMKTTCRETCGFCD